MLWGLELALMESTPCHTHDLYELICCLSGSGVLEIDAQHIALVAGRTILVAPGWQHRCCFDAEASAHLKLICLSPEEAAIFLSPAHAAFLSGVKAAGVSYADHAEGAALIGSLAALVPDGSSSATQAGEQRVAWGAITLLLALHGKARVVSDDQAWWRYRERIEEIRIWLDAHLESSASLEDIASRFGMSRSLLTREFRRHAGHSVVDYCNRRRIERAAMLLASSDTSVTQAAYESGFSNLSHFHRQFKSIYGLTPAGFRRQVSGDA